MALEIQGLSCDYGREPVLRGVSFTLPEGCFLGLLGPNGTGKSTLLKAVGMVRPPQEGRCLLSGTDLARLSPRELARRVSYLPQSTYAPFPIRVMDAVLLGRAPYARFSPGSGDRRIAAAILERLGLAPLAFRDLSQLSGGERQRVLLARALAQQPKLLLLDEPTSSLDLKNQLQTMELVRSLCREEGLTAVAAIHDLNLAAMYCDRFLMLKDASLFACGGEEEVLTTENILAVYGVRTKIVPLLGRRFVLPLEGA